MANNTLLDFPLLLLYTSYILPFYYFFPLIIIFSFFIHILLTIYLYLSCYMLKLQIPSFETVATPSLSTLSCSNLKFMELCGGRGFYFAGRGF